MQASNRRTLGVTGVLATAMILLVVAPRQRVGGRHRRPPALKCNNLVNDREGLTWQRDTEGHTLRSGVAHHHRQRCFAVPLSSSWSAHGGSFLPGCSSGD